MTTVEAVPPGIVALSTAAPPLVPAAALARIEAIWTAEKAARGDALFDGRLFSVDGIEAARITGWWAPYSWFVAQRRDPGLAPILNVCPLAVTGVLLCADGVVFGRRAGDVEQDAGLWELVPAGGIDGSTGQPDGTVDLAAQILAELVEETGVSAAMISPPPRPFALVRDATTHVSDIGILLRTDLSGADVVAAFEALRNREYVALEVVPVADLPAFVANRGGALAPVSVALLGAVAPLLARA